MALKHMIQKIIIRIVGMVIIGISVLIMQKIGLWFLIPWTIGFIVYDIGTVGYYNQN